jgi:ABC-type antimicrobial peptide transport system permease subunit
VVGNIKTDTFDAPEAPHIYFPVYQRSELAVTVFLRTAAAPAGLAESLRRKVELIDPDLPVFGVRSMDQVVSHSMAQRRFALQAMGAFAAVSLALSLMGVYGVAAFHAGERRREIGIRIALGARPGQVQTMVLGRAMRVAAGGLAIGLVGAMLATRFLENLLFDASPIDLGVYLAVSLALLAATLLSSWIPARRATRIDPSSALRAE